MKFFGDEIKDGSTDDFFRAVPENSGGARVPTCNDPIEVLSQNGVVRRFDDGSSFSQALRKRLLLFFHPLAPRYVAQNLGSAHNVATGVLDRRDRERYVEQLSALGKALRLNMLYTP